MKKILLITLLGLVALVLLAAVGIGAFLTAVNPNDYKSYFSQAVHKATGRQLVFEGDIELAIFPELGLKTGGLILRDVEGFGAEPFVTVKGAVVRVALEPLLENRLVVEEVSLTSPTVKLAVDGKGVKNWESGFATGQATGGATSGAAGQATSGAAGQAALQPDKTGQPEAAPTPLVPNQQAEAASDEAKRFSLHMNEISCSGAKIVYRDLREDTGLAVALNDFSLTGLALDKDMDLAFGGAIADEKSAKKGHFTLAGTVRAGSDGSFAAHIDKLSLQAEGVLAAPVSLALQSDMHYAPAEGRLSLRQTKGSVSLPVSGGKNAVTAFESEADILPAKNNAPLTVTANLKLDALNIDALTGLPGQEGAPGSQAGGAPNMPKPKVATGKASAGTAPQQHGQGLNLAGIDAACDLRVGTLVLQGQTLGPVTAQARIQNAKADIPFTVAAYGGSVSGKAGIDAAKNVPHLAVNLEAKNINLEQATKAFTGKYTVSGTVSAKANVQATGLDGPSILASLKGNASVQALAGEVRGFKLIPADLPNISNVPEHFPYERLSASAVIASGTATSKDILLESSALGGRGGGVVRLPQGQMDMGMDFMLANMPPAIPVTISGPYAHLAYGVDMRTFLRNVAESALDSPEAALDLLRKPQSAVELLKDKEKAKGALRQLGGQLFRQ